jgi:hypothetical protein
MKAQHTVHVLGAVLAVVLVAGGCGGNGAGSSNRVTVSGAAVFPERNGGDPVADAGFSIIDPDRPTDPLSDGTTTVDGRYFGVIRKTTSVAVIINGTTGGDKIRVSGLIPAEANDNGKQLDGHTDIACEAGVAAVADGSITGEELDAQRIQNLEDAAAKLVAGVDFTNPAAVTAAANQVRALTDDGAHEAP